MRLNLIKELVFRFEYNIIIVGYRGYGLSEGTPSEDGIKLDGQAIMNYVFTELVSKIDTTKVYIMGRSLGGAVAIYLQSTFNYSIKGLILENTFLSISDLVDKLFPILKPFKNLLLRNRWESKNLIMKIKVPILFIMSDKDELVPYEHMKTLHNLAEGNALFIRKVIGFYIIILK